MSLQDLASLYKEEVESRLAAVRSKVAEKGADEEIKGIGQVLSLFEAEAARRGTRSGGSSSSRARARWRKELEQAGEEARRKALLHRANSARVEDSSARSLLTGEGAEDDEEILRNSGSKLKKSRNALNEMESVGASILGNLEDQTNTIMSANGRAVQTASLTAEARTVLRSMEKGETRSKMIMYGAVVFVVIALVVAFYFILF